MASSSSSSASSSELHAKLDAMWAYMQTLSAKSSAEDINKYGDFFAPDVTAYLSGMSAPPAIGRDGLVKTVSSLFAYWELRERRVLSRAVSEDGTTAIAEMDNVLGIMGDELNGFAETEVVSFNSSGLIQEYRLYCDGTPIRELIQKKMAAAATKQ